VTQSHVLEYEMIGSILKDGKMYPKVADLVSKEMVHNSNCRDIFFAMSQVHESGMVIDAVTVGDQLQRNGNLDAIKSDAHFGRAALSDIRDMGNPRNVEDYAKGVVDYFGKRWLDNFAPQVAYWAQNGRRSADIIADIRTEMDKIALVTGTASANTVNAQIAASRHYDEVVAASKGEIKYARFGFIDLDKFYKIRQGNFALLAARSGDGKTAMLVTVALKNLMEHRKVVFFSLEMTTEEITARFISQMSGVPATRILDGKMDENEWSQWHGAIERFEVFKPWLCINDTPSLRLAQLRQELHKNIKPEDNGLVIVDYIQLMRSGIDTNNRNDEIGEISRNMKEMAKSFDVSLLSAAQLSRDVEKRAKRRPVLADLRESGSLEQDADSVVFLYNESEMEESKYATRKVIVAKQRNGPVGDVELYFDAPLMRFENSVSML